jgi:hypothetical protein
VWRGFAKLGFCGIGISIMTARATIIAAIAGAAPAAAAAAAVAAGAPPN